jgi:hypothetical protein
MIVESIISASYGNETHRNCLYLSKPQIQDISTQNTSGIPVLYNHTGNPIGHVIKMYMDERDRLVAVMKIKDTNIKKGVLDKIIIGASHGLGHYLRDEVYVLAKSIKEISLTEKPELKEALITRFKLEDEDVDIATSINTHSSLKGKKKRKSKEEKN